MSAPTNRVVPWFNRYEFICVYEELCSNDICQQQHALERINVWKSRAQHKMPIAIECTACLVSSQLEYQRAARARNFQESNLRLRSSYSFALIRFLNHITEKEQREQYAIPIHILANELGLPEWMVDTRHEATHGSLPSLDVLRSAVNWALDWLKVKYWEEQLPGSNDQEIVEEHPMEESNIAAQNIINDLLKDYHKDRLQEITVNNGTHCTRQKSILADMEKTFSHNRNESVTCLLKDGFLISTKKQLEALKIQSEGLLSCGSDKLPSALVQFWKPVLRLVHHLQLTASLLKQLIFSLVDAEGLRARLLAGWAETIIDSNENAGLNKNERKEKLMFKSTSKLPLNTLFEFCVRNPNKHTYRLAKRILSCQINYSSHPNGDQLLEIMKAYIGPYPDIVDETSADGTNSTYTIADIHELQNTFTTIHPYRDKNPRDQSSAFTFKGNKSSRLHSCKSHETRSKQDSKGKWRQCSGWVDWEFIPIGILPEQQVTYTSLELSGPVRHDREHEEAMDEDETSMHIDLQNGDYDEHVGTDRWTMEQMKTMVDSIVLMA